LYFENYLPWQQLSVQPSLQQLWPHLSWQQALQFPPLAEGTWAMAVTARTTAKERSAMVRFMKVSLNVNVALSALKPRMRPFQVHARQEWFKF
jgi:hypothetical protein